LAQHELSYEARGTLATAVTERLDQLDLDDQLAAIRLARRVVPSTHHKADEIRQLDRALRQRIF
ncbi:MAG: hypothetical protein KDD55_12000, partial [Bdellovibrionales bacterium]|nr:hypothetical protein [Bdellovibrionales bacterium]